MVPLVAMHLSAKVTKVFHPNDVLRSMETQERISNNANNFGEQLVPMDADILLQTKTNGIPVSKGQQILLI